MRPRRGKLYCILFLHQTTTRLYSEMDSHRCIASSFYIKPQQPECDKCSLYGCIASSFYIKPQPWFGNRSSREGCIASSFYIKPQRKNGYLDMPLRCIASSFYIKPQLDFPGRSSALCCIASSFYIKPQHESIGKWQTVGCIASSFYIKPQPRTPDTLIFRHLTASRHDTKRGGVHRGSRFDAVFTFSTNIRKIIFTEIRRCMSVQRAGARLRSDSSEANI